MIKGVQIMFEGGGSLGMAIDDKRIGPLKELLDIAVDNLVDVTGFAHNQPADNPILLRPSKVCCITIVDVPRIATPGPKQLIH